MTQDEGLTETDERVIELAKNMQKLIDNVSHGAPPQAANSLKVCIASILITDLVLSGEMSYESIIAWIEEFISAAGKVTSEGPPQ